jgi:hypothetical protein
LEFETARHWHFAEMKACGLPECFDLTHAPTPKRFAVELNVRLGSLCAWIEAEDSFGSWCLARHDRKQWQRDDPLTAARASAAYMLARLWRNFDQLSAWGFSALWRGEAWKGKRGLGTIPNCQIQNGEQWAAILEHAATLARKPWQPSDADKWVWMRYPIFGRFKWNAREVLEALPPHLKKGDDDERRFRRKWIERGLRFAGGKTSRRKPRFWDFVTKAQVPGTFSERKTLWLVP